jgi:hypothetical protein
MRKFNILDAAILIAAVAVGLALCRTSLRDLLPTPASPGTRLTGQQLINIRMSLLLVAPVLAPCTIACLILRFRGPHLPVRRLVDFPGPAAIVVVTCVMALEIILTASMIAWGVRPNFLVTPFSYVTCTNPAWAVLGSWLVIFLGGRWEFERSWLHRLEFGLGLAWIGLALAFWGHFALYR